jgi:hypothetical protein
MFNITQNKGKIRNYFILYLFGRGRSRDSRREGRSGRMSSFDFGVGDDSKIEKKNGKKEKMTQIH